MRIRLFLTLASVSFVAAGFGIQACGGSSDDATASKDSGVVEAAVDANKKDVNEPDAAPQCDPTKDFLSEIPDASIADGASSTGACVACSKTNCSAEIEKCAKDCSCQNVAGKALECYAKTQDVLGCFGKLAGVPQSTQAIGLALFGCVQKYCDNECAASLFADAGDGGDGGP